MMLRHVGFVESNHDVDRQPSLSPARPFVQHPVCSVPDGSFSRSISVLLFTPYSGASHQRTPVDGVLFSRWLPPDRPLSGDRIPATTYVLLWPHA